MKLIVTIPAYNEEKTIASVIREIPRTIAGIEKVEVLVLNDGSHDTTRKVAQDAGADYVISHIKNKGLARTFSDAVREALERGADIVVNTDADNHYDQSRIPDLIRPIVEGRADIVIGSRLVENMEGMRAVNKYGNMLGSFFVQKLFGLGRMDVSTGFRAYSKDAALRMNVISRHTYTHETLLQARDYNMTIVEVPIKARPVKRKSRLIKSIPRHIVKSLIVITRALVLYKPLRVFAVIGVLAFFPGLFLLIRFLYYYFVNGGQGHVQSLIVGAVSMILGFQMVMIGLVASAVGWNRKLLEEILYRLRKQDVRK